MSTKRFLLIGALWTAAIISGFLLWNDGRAAGADYDPANPPVTTGCVVRFHSTGPQIHENSAHIEFYRGTEHIRLDDSRIWGEFCNVWLTWHHAGAGVGGTR